MTDKKQLVEIIKSFKPLIFMYKNKQNGISETVDIRWKESLSDKILEWHRDILLQSKEEYWDLCNEIKRDNYIKKSDILNFVEVCPMCNGIDYSICVFCKGKGVVLK